jgi:quercetin dioxygenase-like cupin family protein
MIIGHENVLEKHIVDSPEVKNAMMKVLISPENGWKDHVMRIIELDEGGYTPRHTHAWPHINYVVEGRGLLHLEGHDTKLETGSFAYVPAGQLHQYKNEGKGFFRFICIVPAEGHSV